MTYYNKIKKILLDLEFGSMPVKTAAIKEYFSWHGMDVNFDWEGYNKKLEKECEEYNKKRKQ